MLLNELLKEHRKVEEQGRKLQHMGEHGPATQGFQTAIMKLRKEMETVVARLQEQAGKNSRMSDRVEMSNTAPQIVRLINKPATALWAVQSRAHQRTRHRRVATVSG